MRLNLRGLAVALAACALLATLGWAYRGDLGQVVGGGPAAASYPLPTPSPTPNLYPGPYPSQYLPAVLRLPQPTAEPTAAPPTPTLHAGLSLRWDGAGYILIDGYAWRPGTHLTRVVDRQVDGDTVGLTGQHWYSPNPFDWDDETWTCEHNTLTNRAEWCSGEDDPAWKWSYYWLLPVDIVPSAGGKVTIDGEQFDVTGPHTMDTGFGPATYWRLRSRDRILYYSDGSQWTQYIEPGNANLYYEVGSGMLLYSNLKRTYYKNGESTSDYVQYEQKISQRYGRTEATTITPAESAPDAALAARLAAAGMTLESLAAR